MSWEVFAQVLGSLSSAKSAFDPESTGGGGGGVSAKTQGGGGGLEYIPVGLETLEIPNFDYAFLDQIYQDEEAQQDQQQMRHGGPLYAARGMPINHNSPEATLSQVSQERQRLGETEVGFRDKLDTWLAINQMWLKGMLDDEDRENFLKQNEARPEDFATKQQKDKRKPFYGTTPQNLPRTKEGLDSFMTQSRNEIQQRQLGLKNGGPLYAADGKPLTDIEAQRQAIIQKFIGERPPEMVQYSYASEPTGIETLIEDEVVPEITVEGIEPKISLEEIKADLDNMLAQQEKKDTFDNIMDSFNAISAAKKAFDPEKTGSIKGRGNVVPGAAAGGFRSKPNKLAIEAIGINPFEYKAMKGGGKVLDRGMFAQNYMPNGGALRGPGGPKDDLIPVMASNGEFMLSKAAVDQAGGGNHSKGIAKLEAFNNLGNRRYG